jgi:hypothetical protein
MALWEFYWKVFEVAFSHSIEIAHAILFVLLIVLGLVLYFVPGLKAPFLGVQVTPNHLHAWQAAGIVLASIIIIRLILAPYWIWKEERQATIEVGKNLSDVQAKLKDSELKLNARLSEYPIETAQMNRFIAALDEIKPKPSVIAMAVTNANQGSERYAYALRDALHGSGIDTEMGYTIPDDSSEVGVIICLKDIANVPQEAVLVRAALKKAGIETLIRAFTRNGMHVPIKNNIDWQYVVWVASRPP